MKNFIIYFFLFLSFKLIGGDDRIILKEKLTKAFPGILIAEKKSDKEYQFTWELVIQQELDHSNPQLGKFPQYINLYHKGFKNPNVIATEGSQLGDRVYEASTILDANQFSVEFRFSGKSVPANIPWNLLNHKQALQDLHMIKKKLSKIYKKSWTATGVSKGGTTAALYALTFPKDLKATVAYVAPFVLAQEDERTIEHYTKKVSTQECRAKVKRFQRMMLEKRSELVPMIDSLGIRENVRFWMPTNRVLEYAALEFPFSFWQWGFSCADFTSENPTAEEIFDLVEQVVDFNYYDVPTVEKFLPAMYQFMTEFGYYGFDTTGLSDLIFADQMPSNLLFCPKGVEIKYDPSYMKIMTEKAINHGKNIIYIYGGQDTWSSCAVFPSEKTNCRIFIKQDMGHRVKIRNFAEQDKNEIYKVLAKWMKHRTTPLPF